MVQHKHSAGEESVNHLLYSYASMTITVLSYVVIILLMCIAIC